MMLCLIDNAVFLIKTAKYQENIPQLLSLRVPHGEKASKLNCKYDDTCNQNM